MSLFTPQWPKGWDREFAQITLRYKSGKHYNFDGTVLSARNKALTAIQRKGVIWIKVLIPNPDNTLARLCVWDKGTGWTSEIIQLPRTKD